MANFLHLTTKNLERPTMGSGVQKPVKKSQNFVALFAVLGDNSGNNTCHASRKISAPRRVSSFWGVL
jgi:hypothetical protein